MARAAIPGPVHVNERSLMALLVLELLEEQEQMEAACVVAARTLQLVGMAVLEEERHRQPARVEGDTEHTGPRGTNQFKAHCGMEGTASESFAAMEDLMAEDPCVPPPAPVTCFPGASTSSIQEVQPAVQVSIEPPVCVSPNSVTSSTCSLYTSPTDTPVASPSPVADVQPRKRRRQASDSDLKEILNQQGKMLNTFMLRSEECSSSITKLINHIEAGSSSKVSGNIKHLKIEELQQRLLKLKQEQDKEELKEMQQHHREEMKEMQQHHRQEMKEMQRHDREEMKEMQRHHREKIKEIKQEHREEIKDLQDLIKNYQQHVIQIQEQRNQEILQLLT